jgi:hypothetical protein
MQVAVAVRVTLLRLTELAVLVVVVLEKVVHQQHLVQA